MSEFWKYFHDRLAWPLIHAPGPLSGLVRGMALALDSARDDIVYFRRQWFPELCEAGLVPDFGAGRGLVRHPKETAEQFRARVVNAFRWHRLGGKTGGLPEILRFYGFETVRIDNMRQWQPGHWAEFQIGLATPATQAEQQALLADLDTLLWLVNEYKPARSVLARVYTDTYNVQPLIWSRGFWSGDYWSRFSGTAWPGEEGGDDLVVSFGMAHRVMSDPYLAGGWLAALCHTQTHAFRIPYVDRFIWSRSAWSDSILRNHGFVCGQLLSVHWCDLLYESSAWCGPWPPRPWAVNIRWDRRLPAWSMFAQAWSRSQLMYADRPADGGWGDINATWSVPLVTVSGRPSRWGAFAWSEQEPALRHIRVDEQYRDVRGLSAAPFWPDTGMGMAVMEAASAGHVVYADRHAWSRSAWSDAFPGNRGFAGIQCMAQLTGELFTRPWGMSITAIQGEE